MITLISLIITLGILVTVHEYGHFLVARKCGVKVLRFSVGFGKPLIKWHDRHGTEFVISALPLGGYVKMLDKRESAVDESEQASEFTGKPVLQRIAIVAAGPIANFLFAIFAYWALYMIGVNGIKPYVSGVAIESIAAQSGMKGELVITSVDHKETQTWQDVQIALFSRAGDTGIISISDEFQTYRLPVNRWLSGSEITSPIELLGIQPFGSQIEAVIDVVEPGSAADLGGLLPGDKVLSVNNIETTLWTQLVAIIQESADKPLEIEVLRGEWIEKQVVTPVKKSDGNGFLGVSPQRPDIPEDLFVTVRKGPVDALVIAVGKTWETIAISFKMFGKMLTGMISASNIGGPIAIAKMAGQSAESGIEAFIGFLAFISISLGVVNLLPIPVLDGGHLLYYVIELITKKPLSDKVQAMGFRIGTSLLMFLMIFAIVNDISRLL